MNNMLPERQVFEVIRIEDNCFVGVYYTYKEARTDADCYEADFDEPCRIGRSYIAGSETVEQRNANAEE